MAIDPRLLAEARTLRLKRRFGQNFLLDAQVLEAIAEAALDNPAIKTVLEIGPGAGFLTQALLDRADSVVAVELERRTCAYLRDKFAAERKLTLIEQDFLRYEPGEHLAAGALKAPFAVVGNIPYNITASILFRLCGELDEAAPLYRPLLSRVVLMMQKEVAERVCAAPGKKAYNHLTIAIQQWFDAEYLIDVPAASFYPAPKVDSAVLRLTPRQTPRVAVRDASMLSRLVRMAFNQRRKTLRNALLNGGFASAGALDMMFEQAARVAPVDPRDRAEAVSIAAFGALADAYTLVKDTGQD